MTQVGIRPLQLETDARPNLCGATRLPAMQGPTHFPKVKGHPVPAVMAPIYAGLFGDHPAHACNNITSREAQANEPRSECWASTSDQNQTNPRGVTHSLVVLRQGNPLVRSQSQKASSRLTIEVKPKASSAVKNEDKAASLEPRKAFTPKRH